MLHFTPPSLTQHTTCQTAYDGPLQLVRLAAATSIGPTHPHAESRQKALTRAFNVIAHRAFGPKLIARRKRRQKGLMLSKRFLGHPGVKHQAENVKMGMQMVQRIADEIVTCDLHDFV